jgi:hypothetical protein
MEHFREVEKRTICDKIAGHFYLTREEYAARCPTWCKEACWDVLAMEWSSPKFKERSETNRANRYSRKFKPHKGGSNFIATIREKLVCVQLLKFVVYFFAVTINFRFVLLL